MCVGWRLWPGDGGLALTRCALQESVHTMVTFGDVDNGGVGERRIPRSDTRILRGTPGQVIKYTLQILCCKRSATRGLPGSNSNVRSSTTAFDMASISARGLEDVDKEEEERAKKVRAERMQELRMNSRVGFPFAVRITMASSISFLAGMVLGIRHGSQMAGFRFRAENAHRFPTSSTGWYLYHKSKNYHMAFGGLQEGLKMGAKVTFWTTGFFAIENMFDQYRGSKDFINTVVASLSVAGTFSLWSMLSMLLLCTSRPLSSLAFLVIGLGVPPLLPPIIYCSHAASSLINM